MLCRISPYFCPGAYPAGMEPCWPTEARTPHGVPGRPAPGAGLRPQTSKSAPAQTRKAAPMSPRSGRVTER